MYEFIIKQASKISSFPSNNIHTSLKHLKETDQYPCDLTTKINNKFINAKTNLEESIEKKLVWKVDNNCKLIFVKGI